MKYIHEIKNVNAINLWKKLNQMDVHSEKEEARKQKSLAVSVYEHCITEKQNN